jgi:hypothetical protein
MAIKIVILKESPSLKIRRFIENLLGAEGRHFIIWAIDY